MHHKALFLQVDQSLFGVAARLCCDGSHAEALIYGFERNDEQGVCACGIDGERLFFVGDIATYEGVATLSESAKLKQAGFVGGRDFAGLCDLHGGARQAFAGDGVNHFAPENGGVDLGHGHREGNNQQSDKALMVE